MKKFVIMSGGFHPFHAGHASLYQQAKEAFPDATVLVCATNVQSDRPFPFALKKKLAQLSGVPPKDFIEVSRQFTTQDPALAKHIGDPNDAIVIYVRSEKDRNEAPMPWKLGPDGKPPVGKKGKPLSDYLLEYPGKGQPLDPVSKHAYMAYLKTVEFGPGITSASEIRKVWPTLNDKRKTALVMSLYPAAQQNPKLAQTVAGMFDQVMGGQEDVAESASQTFAGKDPMSFKSPKGGTPTMMIVTGQGSRYLITSDGMVLRNKSFHANTGGDDQGLKNWSDAIEFYDPAEQPGGATFPMSVAKAVEKGLPVTLSKTSDGKRALLIYDGAQWRVAKISDVYKHVASTDEPIVSKYSTTPNLNWNVLDYTMNSNKTLKSVHPGSPVTHGVKLGGQQGVAEGSTKNLKEGARPIGGLMTDPQARTIKDPATGGLIPADDFFAKYPDKNKQAWETALAAALDPAKAKAAAAATTAAYNKEFNDVSWMTPEEQAQYKQLQVKDSAATQAGTRTYGAERFLKQLFQQKIDAKKAASMLKVHWAPLKQLESFLQGKVNNKVELSAYLAPNIESIGKTRWGSNTVGIVLDGHITIGGRGDLGSDQYKMTAGQRGQQKYVSRPGQIDPTLSMDTSAHHEVLIDNWRVKEIVLPADIPQEVDSLVQQYKIPVRRLGNMQGVAEGAPIVVMPAPIDVRNPKKAPHPQRYMGDIVPPTKPPSTEKRGVKGRPGQRPMPKYDEGVAESLDDLTAAYQHHVELSRKYRKKGNREKDQHHTTQAYNILQQIWNHPDYKLEFTDDPHSSQKNDALSMKHDSRFIDQSVEEAVEEEPGPQHRIAVKITDPNTYDDVQKIVRVDANSKQDALDQAEEYFAKKGIYIVNIKYLGMVGQQGVAEDTEFDRISNFAQQHYPGSKNRQEAFMKYVQRALKHSEEDDRNQDEEIEQLHNEIKSLKHNTASSVTENSDFLDEK